MEKVIIKEEVDILQIEEAIILLKSKSESLFVFWLMIKDLGGPQVLQVDPKTEAQVFKIEKHIKNIPTRIPVDSICFTSSITVLINRRINNS